MPVSRAESAARNREALLRAARQAFGADGEQTKLQDVASRAGLTTGAVYSQFGSRLGLLTAVFDRARLELITRLDEGLRDEMSLRETLTVLGEVWFPADLQAWVRLELRVALWMMHDPELAASLRPGQEALDGRVRAILTGRRITGGGRVDPDQAARLSLHARSLLGQIGIALAIGAAAPNLAGECAALERLLT